MLRWRLLLEEYDSKFHYKSGDTNFIADALSRVPTPRTERERRHHAFDPFTVSHHSSQIPADPNNDDDAFYSAVFDDEEMFECFMPYPMFDEKGQMTKQQYEADGLRTRSGLEESGSRNQWSMTKRTNVAANTDCYLEYPKFDEQNRHPFHFETIAHYQQQSQKVKDKLKEKNYTTKDIGGVKLICKDSPNGDFQIVVSDEMLPKLVRWYHAASSHAEGMSHLESSIRRHFYHEKLREEIRSVVRSCEQCQQMKTGGRQFGQLAPREALAVPWQEVHVDSVGPWTVKVGGRGVKFHAMSMIDPVTNLLELCVMPSKKAEDAKWAFEHTWLCRYPRPVRCVHDNGPEFNSHVFQFFLEKAGIKSKPITANNPQSNGIIERVHQTVAQVLRVYMAVRPPQTDDEARKLIEEALAQAMFASRCISHGSLNNVSPGAVAFHRDMFLDLPFVADLLSIQALRQQQIDQRLLKANAKRLPRDWKVGDKVWIRVKRKANEKLLPPFRGPYEIVVTHTNSNVTVRHSNGVLERTNVRHLKPYVEG